MKNNFTHCNKRGVSYAASFLGLLAASLIAGCGGPIDATIGGSVNGLSGGTSVVLLDNGTDTVAVSANGTFTFPTSIEAPNPYNVTVATQPTGETCTVTNGTGNVSQNAGNVTSVTVSCYSTPSGNQYVIGTVIGLTPGATVTLLDNAADSLPVTGSSTGGSVPFVFATALSVGATYNVTVGTQPTGEVCSVTNASGTITANGAITPVVVTC